VKFAPKEIFSRTIYYNIEEEKIMYSSLLSVQFGKILLSGFKYRDRRTIIGDILGTVHREPRGKTKTSIMRGANLNFDQVNKYLQLLILRGLIKVDVPIRSQEIARYRVTEKGLQLTRTLEIGRLILK